VRLLCGFQQRSNHISHSEGALPAAAVWTQNPGRGASVAEGWLSKLVPRDPSPTDAEDNYVGAYVWAVRGLILPSPKARQYP